MPPADGITVRQKSRAFFQQYRSRTAATRNGWRGSYAPNTGHEGGRMARQFRADTVAKVVLHWWSEILRAADAIFV
jgi:hypothetical protein